MRAAHPAALGTRLAGTTHAAHQSTARMQPPGVCPDVPVSATESPKPLGQQFSDWRHYPSRPSAKITNPACVTLAACSGYATPL